MIVKDSQAPAGTGSAAVALYSNHEYVQAAVKQLADNKFDITKMCAFTGAL